MSTSGVNFFANQQNIFPDNWKIFYDLVSGSGTAIPSISGAQSIYSGTASVLTTGGLFSGQNVAVNNTNGLDASDWTMMCVFEKFDNTPGVLFSNYQENASSKSGFVLGVNSANKLYVESYGDNGPSLHEADIELATRNAIAINKLDNRVEFDYFDFNSKAIESKAFSIEDNSFLRSDNWYLGSAVNAPSYFTNNPLNGKIENFLYFTGSVFPQQRLSLFSGLTLAHAPGYHVGLLNESCSYSYLGLTGSISDVTFETIQAAIYCVQSGYLFNKIGQLSGEVSGTVSGGTGTASGYISGYIQQPSGYTISTTGLFSGISGYVEAARGLQVFQNTLPSGAQNYYVNFPVSFTGDPIIFTEVEDNLTILLRKISNVSNSGFNVDFSNPVPNNNYVLTTMAALPQSGENLRFFKTEIPLNTDNFYINFPSTTNPKIFCQMEDLPNEIFSYGISNISNTGFNVNFSNRVEITGAKIHALVTSLGNEPTFEVLSTPLTSGNNTQFISYSPSFIQSPIIFGEMTNVSGESIVPHQISGLSASGFYVVLANNLNSNNYIFNSVSWSGVQSGIGYLFTTGKQKIYLGQVTDTCQNIYNLSGIQDSVVMTTYDLPVMESVYFSGITGSVTQGTAYILTPIYTGIGYTISLNTGQNAAFNHLIVYQNDGSNFIQTNHTLNYSGSNVQPDPFTVYKTCYQTFGYQLDDFTYDTNYIYSFGMDGVHYLQEINDEDLSELYVFPQSHNKTNLDIDSAFDRSANEFFVYNPYTNNDLNVFLNGVGLFPGGLSGSGLVFDYTVSGNYLFTNNFADGTDEILLDVIRGTRRYRNITSDYSISGGMTFLRQFDGDYSDIYVDGVKLVSGIDYITYAGDLQMINSLYTINTTGFLFQLPKDPDFSVRYTGQFNFLPTQRFARNTSMLWANGQRQNLGEDYLEVAKVGLLTGSRNFDQGNTLIFNNDGLFWR